MKVRYIRDWLNGSSANGFNHWVEIQALDVNGINVAFNKTVTTSVPPLDKPASFAVNGSINPILSDQSSIIYVDLGSGLQYMTVDLGALYELTKIMVWHYYLDGRTYNATRTAVSEDGTNWTDAFNSATSGTYIESEAGHTIDFINWITPQTTWLYTTGITNTDFNRIESDTALLRRAAGIQIADAGNYFSSTNVESTIVECVKAIGLPQFLYDEEFTSAPTQLYQTTVNSVSGSVINVTSTGADPMMHFTPFHGTGWGKFLSNAVRYFVVRYRYISGTIPTTMEFFFTNEIHDNADASQMVSCPVIADGQWRVVTVDGWTNTNWKGNMYITGVRFDWCTSSGTTMEFDYIGLKGAGVV